MVQKPLGIHQSCQGRSSATAPLPSDANGPATGYRRARELRVSTGASGMNPNWAYGLIAWIVQQATKLAPQAVRHRLEEEWSADLSALDGTVLQVRFAFGCCLAALAMRGDTFD